MPSSWTLDQFERLVRRMDPEATLLRAWALEGGVSAEVTAVEIKAADGRIKRYVVRRHGPRDLQANPHVAADEARLLETLHAQGLAVPEPRHVDESGEILASPFIVVDYIEGEHEFAPADLADFIRQMAGFLATLHGVDIDNPALSFLSCQETDVTDYLSARPDRLDEALSEGRIRDAMAANWPPPRRNSTVVLHGDFWPGNILWRDGRLAAVVDWEDAASGDPLADLAIARLDLLWAFNAEAMADFTHSYSEMAAIDLIALPCWDLWAALRPAGKLHGWGLDPATVRIMVEKHRLFVICAIEMLDTAR